MQIHQLSVTYLAEQDRILVRIKSSSADEIRLWLTRRLMLGLWPLLSKLLTSHLLKLENAGRSLDSADDSLKQMLADFRKEEFLRQADFETPYQEGEAQMPLGPEPLLITDVDATPLADGRLRLSFNERLPNAEEPRVFQVELQPALMQGLMHLLEQSLARAQWAEPFGSHVPTEAGGLLEDHQALRRPRYLN
ncbi:hypothetical protein [Ramlibacter sp.]|uniref:hypothetical protein n=1 Tax=Ramlibacter sp. TaxID=1917967 RepID=UPI002CE4DE37|nr:hypothetical protein [Ramlibacter sp.]HWI82007.1 hypothetical protein [Ramlibacter sp.]